MSDLLTAMPPMSKEAEIDREIEELLAKLVSGKETEQDRMRYGDLVRRRSQLMSPRFRSERRRVA